MLKFLSNFVLIICSLCFTLIYPIESSAADRDIIILHTNDIHCGVKDNLGMAKLAWLKSSLQGENYSVVLIDAGDAIQGAPIGRLSNGLAMIKIMNKVGYDFCIPGNHEFDYGMERFLQLVKEQKEGYYSYNIISKATGKKLLPPYKVMDFEGTKVALIGVTTPETLTTSTPIHFQNQKGEYIYSFCEDRTGNRLLEVIQNDINAAKNEGAQYIFVVAHIGIDSGDSLSSLFLAQNLKDINGIIDGHSHQKYNLIMKNNSGEDVLIIQTGTRLESIGQINITPEGRVRSKLISEIQGEEQEVIESIAQEIQAYEPLLKQQIGEAKVTLYTTDPASGARLVRRQECNLGNFVADAYRAVLDCDVAIANGGGIRKEIKIGLISYNDLVEAFPFGNSCSVIEVSGQQLLDALEVGVKNCPGESGGFLQVAGMSYAVNTSIPSSAVFDEKGDFVKVSGKYRVHNVMIGKEPLDLNKKYKLGGVDYILRNGGNGMTMFDYCKLLQDAVLNDYDALLEYLQNHLNGYIGEKYSNPYGEGRIVIK